MKVTDTLRDRDSKYGDYWIQSNTAQRLKCAMQAGPNWVYLSDAQKESLELIATKISRILNGDANNIDSWHDISGYAELITERLNGQKCYTTSSSTEPKGHQGASKDGQDSVSKRSVVLERKEGKREVGGKVEGGHSFTCVHDPFGVYSWCNICQTTAQVGSISDATGVSY